jgi:5-formyltetrahydrofolate cyclo-ligase
VRERLLEFRPFRAADCVLFFVHVRGEVRTEPIIRDALELGKRVGLPVTQVAEGRLEFREIAHLDRDVREVGAMSIPEPGEHCRPIPAAAVDLVVVPGLGFDLRGYRIGYGGGFYDRFLPTVPRACKAAVCFELQIVEAVPDGPGDIPVDWLITDRRVIRCQRPGEEAPS